MWWPCFADLGEKSQVLPWDLKGRGSQTLIDKTSHFEKDCRDPNLKAFNEGEFNNHGSAFLMKGEGEQKN